MVGIVQDKEIRIYPLDREDELYSDIELMYNNVFNKKISMINMSKWYKTHPFNPVKEFVFVINNELIAYNYFFPQYYNAKKVYLSGGSMVDPQFKGKFVSFFMRIMEEFNENTIFYGFPNKYSYPIFVHRFGFKWKENTNYKVLNLIRKKGSIGKSKIKFRECDIHSMKINKTQISSFSRNIDWIKWRLQKPETLYIILERNNKYLIYKIFKSSVDILTILNCANMNEYVEMIMEFYDYVQTSGYNQISLMVSNKDVFKIISNYFEYEIDGYERYLCFNALSFEIKNNFNKMFLEMIDSDIY